jgi:hypothetical protein
MLGQDGERFCFANIYEAESTSMNLQRLPIFTGYSLDYGSQTQGQDSKFPNVEQSHTLYPKLYSNGPVFPESRSFILE